MISIGVKFSLDKISYATCEKFASFRDIIRISSVSWRKAFELKISDAKDRQRQATARRGYENLTYDERNVNMQIVTLTGY